MSSKTRIAINGFGRIGRLTLRALLAKDNVDVVAVNDLTDNKTLAHLFKYDSAQGRFSGTVGYDNESLTINGDKMAAFAERNPENLPWKELNVDIVLECTGFFRTEEKAGLHLKAGAKRVIISAPAKGGDIPTIVLGVNDKEMDGSKGIYSNASCTTNCLAPVVKIIDENWNIIQGRCTTTHAYTNDQNHIDGPHSDLRRARSCAINILPSSTGAAKAVAKVYPRVAGKLDAISLRVPVVTGSIIELNCLVEKDVSAEAINAKFQEAAAGPLKGILKYELDPIVSSDIIGSSYSSVFDVAMTSAAGKWVNVFSWYDNEAGYANRLADMAVMLGNMI